MIAPVGVRPPAAEAALRLLLDASPDLAMLVGADGTILAVNERAAEKLGSRAAALAGRNLFSLLPKEVARTRRERFEAVLVSGQPTVFDELIGESVLETHVVPGSDERGAISAVAVFVRDVTALRRAARLQRALLAISEAAQEDARLDHVFTAIHRAVASLMDARNLYIALCDPDRREISFPYFVDEMDTPPEPRPLRRGLTEYVLRREAPLLASPEEFLALEASGEIEPLGSESVDWLGVPLQAEGATIGVLAVQTYNPGIRYTEQERDLLVLVARQVAAAIQRARNQEQLRHSEESYRTLVEHIQDVMYRWEAARDCFTWNQNLLPVFGLPPRSLASTQDLLDHVHPDDRERQQRELADRQQSGGRFECEYRLCRGDGSWATVMDRGAAVTDPDGTVVSLVGILVDLSEREFAARTQAQVQRAEALGQLAGGVAHDFNNLLQAIQGAAGLLRRRLPEDSPGREETAVIQRAADRGAELTRALLAFARRQHLDTRRLDLARMIDDVLPMVRRVIPENISVRHTGDRTLATVVADPGALEHLLINLAVNARDAMPEGGEFTVSAANVTLDEGFLSRKPWGQPGPYVRITVADTGCGMDDHVMAHLFEPFFTTKPPGRGTGLGLATVYGIVKQHQGLIDFTSAPGQGTRVDVYLPAVDAPPDPADPPSPPPGPGRSELVMVVEDEPEVRRVLVEALRAMSYVVVEAGDGVQALEMLERAETPPDLIVTDVVMPRMGGPMLHRRVRDRWPGVRFLFSSGYSRDVTDNLELAGTGEAFLAKPYSLDELASRVRAVLDGAQTPPAPTDPASTRL